VIQKIRWFATHADELLAQTSPASICTITATPSSWLNLVERWFRDLTQQRIRRGSFPAAQELVTAIKTYVENHNQKPQTFVWSAPVERHPKQDRQM
jgi:hypothetical protein